MTRSFAGPLLICAFLLLVGCSAVPGQPRPAPSPTLPVPTPDPAEEGLEATRVRCAREPLEQGRLLFTRAFTAADGALRYDLFYLDLRSKALTPALRTPTPTTLPPVGQSAQGLLIPGRVGGSLSPDGRRIAYFDFVNVVVADADGNNPTIVDRTLLRLSDAIQWSPDGTRIAYVDYISKTARVAVLTPTLSVKDEQADINILSISSYSWPRDPAHGKRLYSAGCLVVGPQCGIVTVAYLSRPGDQPPPPRKVGTNAIYPRWSPVSNLIAALWLSPGNPEFLQVGVLERPDGEPWTPAEALVSGGLAWSPNGCGLVTPFKNQRGVFLFDLARQQAVPVEIPDSVQVLHPQWVD